MEIKNSSPREQDYWLSDEKGLRLLVRANGARYWRMKYRFAQKQKTLALGVYPDVSLKDARLARDKARIQIAEGIDPGQERQKEKQALQHDGEAFSALAKEWFEHQRGTWADGHATRLWNRLESNSFAEFDKIRLDDITPKDVVRIIRKIEARDALDVAARTLQDVRRVFRYGVQTGRLTHNPAGDMAGVLKARPTKHRASLPRQELGQFLRDVQSYHKQGRLLTQIALQLLVYTFVRPGEVYGARWKEFDIEDRIWRIPPERMKMKTGHLVPLSSQVLALLEEARPITEQYELVFPSERDRREPISNNTLRRAIFRMGYDGETIGKSRCTPHGFRANASSILNEQGFNPDAIERQLSHIERNKVRAAYLHHAQYLDERREMMKWWSVFLDNVCHGCSFAE